MVVLLLVFTVWLLCSHSASENSNHPLGYILENEVKHVRLLPVKAAHAFTYNTLSVLVSLDALERGDLDLGFGWIFSYGGLWWRLSGIRSAPYLTPDAGNSQTIRQKLERILKDCGFSHDDSGHRLGDSWMLTMPSYLCLEGINPLTVYFCYQPGGELWLVVLEVANFLSYYNLNTFRSIILSVKVMYTFWRSERMKKTLLQGSSFSLFNEN